MTTLEAVVGLVSKNSPDYVRRFLQLASEGKVVVPLRSKGDTRRIQACGIRDIVEPGDDSGWLSDAMPLSSGPQIAQVAFTSGTEGEAKGILLTHANLTSTVSRLLEKMRMDGSIREYVGIPVYHSFGFARCRAVLAAGGAVYIPAPGFNIQEIVRLLQNDEINSISAVPSLWRMVLKFRDSFSAVGRKVKWIEIGSQSMGRDEKAAMLELFPNATIVQHYGLTEASRATFLELRRATLEELDSVGEPNGDIEIGIAADGRVRIRGSNVAHEMLRNGERVSLVDAEGWLVTNDLGEIRDGKLYYLGRADDVINVGGIKVAPEELERSMARELGASEDFCVVRVPDTLRGDGILIAAADRLPHSNGRLIAAASQALVGFGIDARSSLVVMRIANFPTTESGKVKRRELAQHFQDTAAAQQAPAVTPSVLGKAPGPAHGGPLPLVVDPSIRVKDLLGLYASVFPNTKIGINDSFVGLGGDSLRFVELSTALEAALGYLPNAWHTLSIEKLAAMGAHQSWLRSMDLSVVLRVIAIVAIVGGHFEAYYLSGSAYLLIVVAGYNFARFQLPVAIEVGSVRSILHTAGNVALPAMAAMIILGLRQSSFDIPGILLFKNWIVHDRTSVDLWFLEVLVQILLLMALLLSIRGIRTFCGRYPFGISIGLLLASLLAVAFIPRVWNTEHLSNRLPHMVIWLFFLGWLIYHARTLSERLQVVVLAVIGAIVAWSDSERLFWVGYGAAWVIAGTVSLLFIKTVRIPWPLNKVIAIVAAATLFIYITHPSLRHIWQNLGLDPHVYLEVAMALVCGVVVHAVWQRLLRASTYLMAKRSSATDESDRTIL